MRVMGFVGSPRKAGNTDALVGEVLKHFRPERSGRMPE